MFFIKLYIVQKSYILALILFFSFSVSFSQFDDSGRVFRCAAIFGDSITFLNDFNIHQSKRKTKEDPNGNEWEVYLMKGTVYRFALCCEDGINDLIMRLYNEEFNEENPLGSTGLKSRSKHYFDFICYKSDIYKVSLRFKKEGLLGKQLTAIGLLGFIRKIK